MKLQQLLRISTQATTIPRSLFWIEFVMHQFLYLITFPNFVYDSYVVGGDFQKSRFVQILSLFKKLFGAKYEHEITYMTFPQIETRSWKNNCLQMTKIHFFRLIGMPHGYKRPKEKLQYYSIQEKMFFEGITTHKACIKIELSRKEWVSVLLWIIFDDFGMIWIPRDQWLFQQILYISTT